MSSFNTVWRVEGGGGRSGPEGGGQLCRQSAGGVGKEVREADVQTASDAALMCRQEQR
jgi:hypothetical protein